jgi:hypothetical protein
VVGPILEKKGKEEREARGRKKKGKVLPHNFGQI